jgi:hypothetical protein
VEIVGGVNEQPAAARWAEMSSRSVSWPSRPSRTR